MNAKKQAGGRSAKDVFLKYGIYFILLFIVLILAVTSPSFRTVTNVTNVLLQVVTYGCLGIGMTFVIMTGGIDVSVGGIMVCSGSVYVVLAQSGMAEGVNMLMIFVVALIFGIVNGYAVAYIGMPPFLVTLATQCIGRGLSLVFTGGASFRDLGPVFEFLGKTKLLGISIQIWVMLLLFVIGYFILHKTVYGRKLTAVGGNLNAARVSGINDRMITCSAYIVMSILCAIAAYLTMARLGSYYSAMGDGIEFMVIAAVVIGGTSMSGGSGTIIGTLAGTVLIGIINNALNLFHVGAEWQDVAEGAIIFLAVLFDAIKNKAKSSN